MKKLFSSTHETSSRTRQNNFRRRMNLNPNLTITSLWSQSETRPAPDEEKSAEQGQNNFRRHATRLDKENFIWRQTETRPETDKRKSIKPQPDQNPKNKFPSTCDPTYINVNTKCYNPKIKQKQINSYFKSIGNVICIYITNANFIVYYVK